MTGAYRAWEFIHPDFGTRPGDVGLPLEQTGLRVSPNGTIAIVEQEASVRQAILLLVTTRPGERVMRPDYGCMLYTLAFSPNDATTAGLAMHYVGQALQRWEPRIRVLRLDAGADPEAEDRLNVFLEYRVLASNKVDRLLVPVSLSGRGT